jgi:serine/threonine protein phosphatase PrpC
MADAIASAHEAICAHAREHRSPQPPGTTCVAALIVRDRLIVGWVGDSRAYWLNDRRVDLLTRDHSWVNEAVANGEATLQEAMRSPYAHALTRCLGPLEPGEPIHPVRPDVITRTLTGPGLIVLCSDGLWNYYPIPEQMGALVQRCGPSPTVSRVARFLVHKALSRGGQDNIAVAVYGHTRPGSAA